MPTRTNRRYKLPPFTMPSEHAICELIMPAIGGAFEHVTCAVTRFVLVTCLNAATFHFAPILDHSVRD